MTATQLNQAAALLNTTDKNVVITACIKALITNGMEVSQAFDHVLGAGQFDEMTSKLYDELKAA